MQHQNTKTLRKLVLVSILLAIVVVSLGAYTRLTHAGLGCPDWPGCYGLLDVPESSEQISKAEQAFPDRPVEPEKAWNEMIHRYFAGSLGLLILAIALLSFKNRDQGTPVLLPLLILAVVTFQAALGMWTVTMMLMPIVVMGHLLGGFATLCLLFLLYLRLNPYRVPGGDAPVRRYARYGLLGIVILVGQIALGGWTSSNYAALVCVELPVCQAGWVDQLTFEDSFDVIPPERETYEFGHLDHNERVTIHVMHRLGAIVTAIYLLWLALTIFIKAQTPFFKNSAISLVVILTTQILLGASNIWFSLPLSVAVSHNVVAACLMLMLIALTYSLKRKA
ncbi:MAG: COX15/CtaA family protein [Colwelliaceae bacterium]|jgi:cytochrome c oxidase assembly protein subunit 15|nr:COX15/CtaA family protein [Colwelliaceae bacterium]